MKAEGGGVERGERGSVRASERERVRAGFGFFADLLDGTGG